MNFCKDCKFHEFYAEHGWECTNENYRDSYTVTDPVRGVISRPKCDVIRRDHPDCQHFEKMEVKNAPSRD